MILNMIKSIISGRFVTEYTAQDIDFDTTFEDLELNEFDMAELCMGLEAEFDIELDDDKIDDLNTIGELAEMIEERL